MLKNQFLKSLKIVNHLNVGNNDTAEILTNIHDYIDHGCTSYTDALAIGLCTTGLLNSNIKIKLIMRDLQKTSWSQASLSLNSNLTEAKLIEDYHMLLKNWIFTKITKCITPTKLELENSYNICIIRCASGHLNIKNFIKKWNISEIPNNISTKYKVTTFKVENTLYILTGATETALDQAELVKKITGWLPVLLKECFQEALKTKPLYNFFKACYDNRTPDLEALKTMPCIQNIYNSFKLNKMQKALEKIKTEFKNSAVTKETLIKNQITNLENEYNLLTQQLHAIQLRNNADNWFENENLILQFLTNNPNIVEVSTYSNSICLKTYGPVDYDKIKIKTCLKRYDNIFVKILTDPDLQMYWEAACLLNLQTFTIKNASDFYNPYTYLPNIHWSKYNCFGDNKIPINKALKNNDLLSALMQAATAAQALNIYDVTVINKLHDTLRSGTCDIKPFLNTKTNTFISYYDAEQFIEDKEETANANEDNTQQ